MTTTTVRNTRPGRRFPFVRRAVWIPFAWALGIFNVFVLVWMVGSSFKTTRDMLFHPWGIPTTLEVSNYVTAWNEAGLSAGVLNSVILVVVAGLAGLALSAPAAYALSRFGNRGSTLTLMFFILGMGIPNQVIFIPLYIAFSSVGLVNTILGLVIIYTATSIPRGLFLLAGFFRSLPRDVEEAAVMDGASTLRTFVRIVLPQARSGLLTVFLLQAIAHWGETFFALVMLHDKTTISITLLNFMHAMQYTGARWAVLMAGLTIVVLPLLAMYIWLGNRIIDGMATAYGGR